MPDQPNIAASTSDGETTESLLRRILVRVEQDRRRGRLELALAIMLSLATLCSTWCGYQANSWGGLRSSSQSSADTAERKAAEDTIVGLQLRTFDGIVLTQYWSAMRANDSATAATIHEHMRPQLRAAVEASVADGILTNPKVVGPLQRPEYVLEAEESAARQRTEAENLRSAAGAAGRAADSYVQLTLMFASVLFFGGITGTFTARRVRLGLSGAAMVVFLIALAFLVRLPVNAA